MATTTSDRKDVNFSVKLSAQELGWLEDEKARRGESSVGEVIRDFVKSFRTWYQLPPYQAQALEKDCAKRGLKQREYIQEILARHYQAHLNK